MAPILPRGVIRIKEYDSTVEGEKFSYIAYTGSPLPPPGEWGSIGDIFQDDGRKPTRIWFHDGKCWEEGAINTTPHPVNEKKLLLGVTRGKARWLNPTTIRTRKSKGKDKADSAVNAIEEPTNNSGLSMTGGAESPAPGGNRRVSREEESGEDREQVRDFDGGEGTPEARRRKGEEVSGEVDRNHPSGDEQGQCVYLDRF
jgi:hypothetical protein